MLLNDMVRRFTAQFGNSITFITLITSPHLNLIGGVASGMTFVFSTKLFIDGSGLKSFSKYAANTFALFSLLQAHSPVCVSNGEWW